MSYTVYIKKSAEKEMDRLSTKVHSRITKHLLSLSNSPRPFGTKKLFGREEYRTRIGNYRILYIINEKEKKVEIVSVGHRKEVYRIK
jgi:mRNA interferase RelE/StbE